MEVAYLRSETVRSKNIWGRIAEARNSIDAQQWEAAIQEEMLSVNYNKTLAEPMELPKGERATKLKFLFALKIDDNGHVERHKAR